MRRTNSGDYRSTWYFLEDWDVPHDEAMNWTKEAVTSGLIKRKFSGHVFSITYNHENSLFTVTVTG